MKLEYLKLCNFRQYYGSQKLKFSTDPVRNVTVINGNNGAGKTSLFLALNWCLYGVMPSDVGELVNKRAAAEAQVGDTIEVSAELGLVHGGQSYFVSRTARFVKTDSSTWHQDGQPELLMMRTKTGAAEEVSNPAALIESFLPSNVRPYFFFDGEKIDEFARPSHESEVEEAIRNVVKVEILERTQTHLDSVAREINRELRAAASGRLQELFEQEDLLRSRKDELNRELTQRTKDLLTKKRHLDQLDAQLGQVKEVRGQVDLRRELENQKARLELELDDASEQLRLLSSRGFIGLTGKLAARASEILDDKRNKGEIPSGIREQFIKDLLERGECICGRRLDAGSEARAHVEQWLHRSVSSELENAVLNASVAIRNLRILASQVPELLRTHVRKIAALEQKIEETDSRIREISRQLQQHPEVEEVGMLEKSRYSCMEDIDQLNLTIGKLRHEVEDVDQRLSLLDTEINKVKAQEDKAAALKRKYLLARSGADYVEAILEAFARETRRCIQEEAQRIFKKLIWKDSQFTEISLGDDYKLEVIDRWGRPARPELSAGERQVLSLSFIAAMARVAGEEAPIVMDTPFGRLSSAPREAIAENLPTLTSQLVLLVQDEELKGESRRKILPRIGVEYVLEFDQTTGCTSIVQV